MPVQLSQTGGLSTATGSFVLKRLDYRIGEGDWKDTSMVADEVLVEGACEGEIAARDRIELRPTARVRGQMTAPRVVMTDGAHFDGRWLAGSPAADAGVPKPSEEPAADPDPAAASAPKAASIPA